MAKTTVTLRAGGVCYLVSALRVVFVCVPAARAGPCGASVPSSRTKTSREVCFHLVC